MIRNSAELKLRKKIRRSLKSNNLFYKSYNRIWFANYKFFSLGHIWSRILQENKCILFSAHSKDFIYIEPPNEYVVNKYLTLEFIVKRSISKIANE